MVTTYARHSIAVLCFFIIYALSYFASRCATNIEEIANKILSLTTTLTESSQ